ncbi:MAG: adenosylmethionine--8-amino-7-oxononanoate transaminase [Pedosphaera sp.]|nr:adenosylmethionine--8-amino-7-oxononanoate transaminase [Pedosphaera sp.]
MQDWLKTEPIVLTGGRGSILYSADGRRFLDANSSIWTNLHGHRNAVIDAAIRRQLKQVAHTSSLGFASGPASELAADLIDLARGPKTQPRLTKVFFSDDGSTAIEAALKLASEYSRRAGISRKPRFLSLTGAYHGDTVGAVSVGHIDLFHRIWKPLLFPTDSVMAPACYRCPFNRAKPERADARTYRKCSWECVSKVEAKFAKATRAGRPYTALVVEPSLQGAAGMIPQPEGWLSKVAEITRGHKALLIADEVMTGFGRTGTGSVSGPHFHTFAAQHEGVVPDLVAVAKGLTGGYLPMAATFATQPIFDSFLGEYSDFKTFFHGHSYSGNQLGAAAALANLSLLRNPIGVDHRRSLQKAFAHQLNSLWTQPYIGDIRLCGLVAGIELVRDWRTRTPFDLTDRVGIRVCEAMARRGVLTRPIGNVLVLMPPYCTTSSQVHQMVAAVVGAITEVLGKL